MLKLKKYKSQFKYIMIKFFSVFSKNKSFAINDMFYKIKRIGTGRLTDIFKIKEKKTGKYFTCKIVNNNYQAKREVYMLKNIHGSKLQKLHTTIRKENKIHILTNYIPGKDLFEKFAYLSKKKKLNKDKKNNIIKEMANCIEQLHQNNFVHLDIKLENFIVYEKKPYQLKLIDFATCHPLSETQTKKLQLIVGTYGYSAPEIYDGYYHKNSDIWSLGVCIWCITTGFMPFDHKNFTHETIYNREIKNKFIFPSAYHIEYKNLFTKNQFDILHSMFEEEPSERMSIKEFKQTPWVEQ